LQRGGKFFGSDFIGMLPLDVDGVVDENVNPPESTDAICNCGTDAFMVKDVTEDEAGF